MPTCLSALKAPRRAASALVLIAVLGAACAPRSPRLQVAGGEPERGRAAIERYGCIACHTIAGIASHGANIGPPLVSMAERGYIGGVLPNTPENLVRWLRDPPAVDPRTAMPNVGLSSAEAADIAAYLYTH